MKLKCEILSVETRGDTIAISLQGKSPTDADWRPLSPQTIIVTQTEKMAKALYVGRRVEIEVRLK